MHVGVHYYDERLRPGFSEGDLSIYHFSGGVWTNLGGTVDEMRMLLGKIAKSTQSPSRPTVHLDGLRRGGRREALQPAR